MQAADVPFDFICVPVFHPLLKRDQLGISGARTAPGTRSDLELDSSRWTTCVVGKLSPWLQLDSPSPALRSNSIKTFKEELAWCSHLGVPAILCPPVTSNCFTYAQLLTQAVTASSFLHAWVTVPLVYPHKELETYMDSAAAATNVGGPDASPEASAAKTVATAAAGAGSAAAVASAASAVTHPVGNADDPWHAWNTLRCMAEYSTQISVALQLSADLPEDEILERWTGEPVKAALLPTSLFVANKAGFPVLMPRHKRFVQQLYRQRVQFILQGRASLASADAGASPYSAYVQYLSHILTSMPDHTDKDDFESPYYDYLQAPLQPLMDNLESQTYETFERDPIKYQQYEKAVYAALMDTPADKVSVVMVVGAGRGPLVRRSIAAANDAKRSIRVYAVEKNPNAVITLRALSRRLGWDGMVTIVHQDMREWQAPEGADIMVSELLGSWGDNELSPECLDGAQRFLKPDGISIPYDYTSYLSPVTSSKLWNEVAAQGADTLKQYETAYVVKMHNHKMLAPAKALFKFEHPNPEAPIGSAVSANPTEGTAPNGKPDNSRYSSLTFTSDCDATLHGFGGYFIARLYKDIDISIEPATHSPGMFSWFPLFVPLRQPQAVAKGDTVAVHVWRCVDGTKVWYEWATTSPAVSPIHNPTGRSYWIGL